MGEAAQLSGEPILPPGDSGSATALHIGEEQVVVTCRNGHDATAPITLPIGARTIARSFRHTPPTESEMEHAIMLVEDALFRIRHAIVKGSVLSTTDAGVRTIAAIAGVPDQQRMAISRELVEQTFNRLAAIVQGRPASLDTLPTDAEFAAILLILREFMHHLDFAFIEVTS